MVKQSKKQVRKHATGKPVRGAKIQVQSAASLGLLANKLGVAKKASTHKGRKILENRASKIAENPKRVMIMKGRKSNKTMNDLMKDLQLMKNRERVQMLMRHTHDILPMEDASLVENQAKKYDCSLFAVGSH